MNTEVIDKSSVFAYELRYITNERYLKDVKFLISLLPDYFFVVPASSTGKYHPSFSQGKGGLLRHTKVAVKIAIELLENETIGNQFSESDKELIVISLILHDGLKKGPIEEKYTRIDHPLLISNLVKINQNNLNFDEQELKKLTRMLERHMGQWNTDYYNKIVLDKPKTNLEKFVHMCDFLSSKRFLDIKFDNKNNIID